MKLSTLLVQEGLVTAARGQGPVYSWAGLNQALTGKMRPNSIVSVAGALRGKELSGYGDSALYEWEDINQALMGLGMAPNKIVKVLFDLPKVPRPRMAAHKLKVGDILASSWGYDQTNISFYEVLAVTDATATVQRIDHKVVETKPPYEKVMPVRGKPRWNAKPQKKRVRPDGSIKITEYESAYPWDGKPESQTMSAYGH